MTQQSKANLDISETYLNSVSPPATEETQEFVFLLLEGFSMMSFASAIEPLRVANRMMRQSAFRWRLLSENGEFAVASNGIQMKVDGGLEELTRDQTIMVCGGLEIAEATTKQVLNWLRREARRGMAIGGLCTASYTLAKAGLTGDRRITIHWENRDSLIEEFPDANIQKSIFTIDRNRYTSAGGTASADLMLKIISEKFGTSVANDTADQLIYTTIRTEKDDQRLSVPTRIGVRHPRLAQAIQMMEENIEAPLSPSELAEDVGMSTRQLERLFRRYLDRSPKRYYMELRLQRARHLLLQTDMSVINVALACGFASPSHFSKCYRSHFNTTPYRERGAASELSQDK